METGTQDMDVLDCCDVCGEEHSTEDCPELGLGQVKTEIQDNTTRARLTLPGYLQVVDNGDGLIGVIAKQDIPVKTQFGPYEAKRTTHVFEDTGFFTLKLIARDGSMVCLDTTDEMDCNWLCLVRAATTKQTQNTMAYQLGSNIFYNTTRVIKQGEELQVWYAPHFAKKLGKPSAPDEITKVLLGHRIEPLDIDAGTAENDLSDDYSSFSTGQDSNTVLRSDSSTGETGKEDTTKTQNTGKIWPAFWCPRCGKTFSTQAKMVLHLREHVLSPSSSSKKNPFLRKRGPGRPRKNPLPEPSPGPTSHLKARVGRPPKRKHITVDSGDRVDTLDVSIEDADVVEEEGLGEPRTGIVESIGTSYKDDNDYTPTIAIRTSLGSRVQPTRQRKGQTSRFHDSYVTPLLKKIIKKEPVELGIAKVKKQHNLNEPPAKRKRGRPKVTTVKDVNDSVDVQEETVKDVNDSVDVQEETVKVVNDSVDVQEETDKVESDTTSDTVEENSNIAAVSDTMLIPDNNGNEAENEVSQIDNEEKKELEVKEEEEETSLDNSKSAPQIENQSTSGVDISGDLEEDKTTEDVDVPFTEDARTHISSPSDGDNVIIVNLNETEASANAEDEHVILTAPVENDKHVQTEECDENEQEGETGDMQSDNTEMTEKEGTDISKLYEIIPIDPKDDEYTDSVRNNKLSVQYKCKVCMKMFQKLNYLKLHLPKHTGQFQCQTCDKRFTRRETLQGHVCDETEKNSKETAQAAACTFEQLFSATQEGKVTLVECKKCDFTSFDKFEARQHCREHIDPSNLQCSVCQHEFGTPDDLLTHACNTEGKEFPCDICKQAFKSAKYLYRHMAMHTDIFRCGRCDRCFSRKDSLQKHVLRCCPEAAEKYNIHTCDTCAKTFSTKFGKRNHMTKCKLVKCEKCTRIFASAADMEEHECSDTEHADGDTKTMEYTCAKCDKSFLSFYYLSKHMLIHKGQYSCPHCKKAFARNDECDNHAEICKQVREIKQGKVGICGRCGETFNKSQLFREHALSHTHPYSCEKCGKRFVKIGTLKSHICVGLGTRYECVVCRKCFSCDRFLERHMKLHGEPKYKCQQCNQDFHRKESLNDHICKDDEGKTVRVVRNGGVLMVVEKFVCETCGKDFVNKSNLAKHRISHGEKHFDCETCGKKFHYETYLKEHISSVHMNIFKYQCSHCGKMLKSKTGLVSHVKQFHSQSSVMFECPTCGKRFRQKGNLKTHMFSHEKGRQFACNFCGKTFKYPDQLNRHKLTHTMVNKLQCEHCEKKFCKPYELKKHQMTFHSGYVYVCEVCSARCGHRHTIVRHYKRKHPTHIDYINEEGYVNSLLKHTNDLPEEAAQIGESIVQLEVQLNSNQLNMFRSQVQSDSAIMLPGSATILPQDAAEALQSLSSAVITSSQLADYKEERILDTQSTIVAGQIITASVSENESSTTQKILAEQIISADSEVLQEGNSLGVIANSNGTISINGQEVSFKEFPQTIEGIDGGENQIVILQIVDPESGDTVTGEAIQVQGYDGGTIQVQDLQNM